jgi:hypothetical protein
MFDYPDDEEGRLEAAQRVAVARHVCSGCPVRIECLGAITTRDEGVLGGLLIKRGQGRRRAQKEEARRELRAVHRIGIGVKRSAA